MAAVVNWLCMTETAGFVLAGGRSSRMGRDKALLELDGEALLDRVARRIAAVAGTVAIVGDPLRHAHFGWPVVTDLRAGREGPLAGIEAALASPYAAQWNLIVACDMPHLDPDLLARLLAEARRLAPDCVIARSERGIEPLCAVYGRAFGEVARAALDAGQRKVRDALDGLQVIHLPVDSVAAVANVNTPEDWLRVTGGGGEKA